MHEDGSTAALRSRLLDHDDLTDLRGVEHTCHLVQRWVDKTHDARVVVIGSTMTAVGIHARSRAARIDRRADHGALDYELVDIPREVATGIGRLMARFGLNVGALDAVGDRMPLVTGVLEREMYSEAEAARLLRVPQGTLNYWLEGGERRGKAYLPVIRPEPRGGHPPVTWAEFVEAGWLRMYRRTQAVPMAQLRAFIDKLRQDYGIPYPLADRRPLYVGRQLVIDAQEEAGLDPEFRLAAAVEGQILLLGPGELFVNRVQWDGDAPAAWRPVEDERSPVLIDPERRFGQPSVRGISTEVIFEHIDGGEDEHYVADGFELSIEDVRWAMAYETSSRAA